MNPFDKNYWKQRYLEQRTTWDTGAVTPPLKAYFDQLTEKNSAILIPGAGNAYEAEYLFRQGFRDVTIIDIAKEPLENFQARVPDFPKEHLMLADFFEHSRQYDLIVEQTFFCALDPSLRMKYAETMHRLLKPGGKLAGLLFNRDFNSGEPPFGGNAEEYRTYFEPYFQFLIFEDCYNSIGPRQGKELFIELQKK